MGVIAATDGDGTVCFETLALDPVLAVRSREAGTLASTSRVRRLVLQGIEDKFYSGSTVPEGLAF